MERLSPAEALREAAREIEHQAEFNVGISMRWSAARQSRNNQLINQSRELNDRADALDRIKRPVCPSCRFEMKWDGHGVYSNGSAYVCLTLFCKHYQMTQQQIIDVASSLTVER